MKLYRTNNWGRLAAFAALAALLLTPLTASAQKLKPEELVAKHLQSIGTAEARAAVKSRLMGGPVAFTLRSGVGQNTGLALLFSEGDKSAIAMNFANPKYPHDKFGFDGQKVSISYIQPGVRSEFGDFIKQREQVIKLGLMGGVLSTNWALNGLDEKVAKLEYGGITKIDGKPVHKLRFNPRKGSDLKITLYFDQENFRHLRTEYEQLISNQMGGVDTPREFQRELRLRMIEDFSDFKEVGGLTLPHTYEIKLDLDRQQRGKYQAEWRVNLEKFDFNQDLKDEWFDVTSESNPAS